MADLSSLILDTKKSTDGVWVPWESDIELLLRPMNNEDMEHYIRETTNSKRRGFRRVKLSDEETERLTAEAIAAYVLVGWKNLQMGGVEVPYSKEKALEFLTNPGLRALYQFVILNASDEAIFRAEIEQAELGN